MPFGAAQVDWEDLERRPAQVPGSSGLQEREHILAFGAADQVASVQRMHHLHEAGGCSPC